MNKEDRVRACYQHCCLKYVAGEDDERESAWKIGDCGIELSNCIQDHIGCDSCRVVRLDDASKSR